MIRKKQRKSKLIIDLTGPDGNAFVLLGHAKQLAGMIGVPSAPILEEMMQGDYEHLLEVFDREFGTFVILER